MNINRKNYTITQLDILDIYAYVKFNMIKQVVKFYSKGLSEHNKSLINIALQIIEFI